MHYRVESIALPRAKTFKNGDKAVSFAKELAKKTTHEVRVVIVSRSSSFGNPVLYVFNRRSALGDGS
jgi:hypothetical protein